MYTALIMFNFCHNFGISIAVVLCAVIFRAKPCWTLHRVSFAWSLSSLMISEPEIAGSSSGLDVGNPKYIKTLKARPETSAKPNAQPNLKQPHQRQPKTSEPTSNKIYIQNTFVLPCARSQSHFSRQKLWLPFDRIFQRFLLQKIYQTRGSSTAFSINIIKCHL